MAKYGHPGSSGTAQSGGKDTTFGGGKGGTAQSKKATNERKVNSGRLNNGLQYNLRSEAGDNSPVPQSGGVGMPPPVFPGKGPTIKKVHVNKPVRGGSS